jgi:hypothetical protein
MKLSSIYEQLLIENQLGIAPLRQTSIRVCSILQKANIECELIGGYAVSLYGYNRSTNDTDFIVSQKDQAIDALILSGQFKSIPGNTMTIIDKNNGIGVDIVEQGKQDNPKAIPYPDPINHVIINDISVIPLRELIELKLSAFISSGIKRLSDKSDAIKLIMKHNLSENFLDNSEYTEIIKEYKSIWNELNPS